MNARNLRGLTMGLVNPVLVKGTTSTYSTSVTSAGVVNGIYATALTAQTNTATPTSDAATGAAFVAQTDNTACCYVFGITVGGAIAVCQGAIVPTEVGVTTTAGAFINPPPFPSLPDNFYVIGYGLVRTAPSASDFTFGSTAWDATGVTTSTLKQCNVLPDRPQIT